MSGTSSTIYIDDIFANALIDYTLFRCYLKDAEFAGNSARAGTHFQLFSNSLGTGGQAQFNLSPNQDAAGNVAPVAPQQVVG